MRIEVILFDWGGTLVSVNRQAEALLRGAAGAAMALGLSSDSEAADRLAAAVMQAERRAAADPTHREADLEAVAADWAQSMVGPLEADVLAAIIAALGEAWVGSLDLLDGVIETIQCLRGRGYRMGLVSNCCVPPTYCQRELARQGLAKLLDFAVFSSAIGYRKPSEKVYQEALRQAYPAGRPADLSGVLFVGDAPLMDVIAPAAMGMKTVLVRAPAGTWPLADYARARPDFRIDSVADLPALLNHARS